MNADSKNKVIRRRNRISIPRFNPEFRYVKDEHGLKVRDRNGRPKVDKNEHALIYLVYRFKKNGTGDHVRLKYSTREYVLPNYWISKIQRAKVTAAYPEYHEMNSKLDKISSLVQNLVKSYPNIETHTLKNELDYSLGFLERPKPEGIASFLDYIERQIDIEKSKVNKSRTFRKYQTVLNHLKEYMNENGISTLGFDDIDMDFFHSFLNYLYSAPRNHSKNTAAKTINCIKLFLKRSYEKFYTNEFGEKVRLHRNTVFLNPDFKVSRVKTTKVVLSFEELQTLYDFDLKDNQRLERVRDIWLIMAYTGLRISDFWRLQPENIKRDGKYDIISINTYKGRNSKQDNSVFIPLMPQLKTILEKYNWGTPERISEQKMNDYIKELCELAGINSTFERKYSEAGESKVDFPPKWKYVTNHSARYSFITNMLSLGVEPVKLSKITGQSIKVLLGYEHIDKQKNAVNVAESLPDIFKKNSPLKVVK